MKEGWEYKRIKDIGSVIAGTTPNTNVAEFWDGTLCWISPAELDGGHYLYDSRKKITEAAVKAKSLKLLPEGTVILSSRAPIGKVVINKVPTYCNQGFKCVVCSKEIYNEFLYWWFWGKTEYLNSLGTGATFKEISKKVVEEITIPVPPLSEQQSIVDYLDSAFAKIDTMKANAEKAQSEAKALFQSSLKEMLEPKDEWEEKKLGEICSQITDGTHHSPPNGESGNYKYITAKNIRIWGLDLSNVTYVSEDIHKEITARCNPQKGDVLYIKDGATTGIAIVNPLEEEFSMLSSVALIKPYKDVLSSEFLCYTLNSPSIYNQTRSQMDGAAITRVTLVKIKGFVISIPPLSEQQSIVETLDSLKSKVDQLQANYEKISKECDALKQAILRQVFE